MADETDGDTEQMVTTQNSLEMQAVEPMNKQVKSTSVSADNTNNQTVPAKTRLESQPASESGIEKKDTTLKDKGDINNDDETIDIAAIQEKVRKQSLHLREIGDEATLRELNEIETHKQERDHKYASTRAAAAGTFLGDELRATDSIIQVTPTSSFLIRHDAITTILIDEFDTLSDVKEQETIEVSLPRSPMASLILMESIGIWEEMDNITKASIYCAIFLTMIIQFAAAGTLYFQKFFGDYDVEYVGGFEGGLFNLVVMSFVVIYLAQDGARMYKMLILVKHVTSKRKMMMKNNNSNSKQSNPSNNNNNNNDVEAGRTTTEYKHDEKRLKRRDIGFLWFFIFSNILFYIFLLYYAMIETLQRDSLATKLQVAIAVFFVLELDDWLYNVTIEPLKVLEDSVFELRIRGNKGKKKKRFRAISTYFWTTFFVVEILVGVLYYTETFEHIRI